MIDQFSVGPRIFVPTPSWLHDSRVFMTGPRGEWFWEARVGATIHAGGPAATEDEAEDWLEDWLFYKRKEWGE